jgi:hypothetical protein
MKKYWKKIGFYFARKELRRELKNRKTKRETVSFDEAKKIGVLFVANTDADIQTAYDYIEQLKTQKQVEYLGLITIKDYKKKNKEVKDSAFIFGSDFNFFHHPKKSFIENFYKTDFDLLLSLNYTNNFTLNYISSLSKARLRVGKYYPNNVNAYDLMIDNKEQDMKSYIDQLQHYIHIIKK